MSSNRAVDVLMTIRGKQKQPPGLKIVRVATSEPAPITLVFEGTDHALDLVLFEIPVDFYPLRVGDRLLVYPMVGADNNHRYAALQKLNGGQVFATFTAGKLEVAGMEKKIESFKPVKGMTLQDGDQVAIVPYLEGVTIKYAIINKY